MTPIIPIVDGYKQAFKHDVMGDFINLQLSLVKKQISFNDQHEIIQNLAVIRKQFPELINFWQGLAAATHHTLKEIYLVAWSEGGLFTNEIQKDTNNSLEKMTEITKKTQHAPR